MHLPMMIVLIWYINISMGANVNMGIEGSTSTRPHIDYDSTNYLALNYDHYDGFGLSLMIGRDTELPKTSFTWLN